MNTWPESQMGRLLLDDISINNESLRDELAASIRLVEVETRSEFAAKVRERLLRLPVASYDPAYNRGYTAATLALLNVLTECLSD